MENKKYIPYDLTDEEINNLVDFINDYNED